MYSKAHNCSRDSKYFILYADVVTEHTKAKLVHKHIYRQTYTQVYITLYRPSTRLSRGVINTR